MRGVAQISAENKHASGLNLARAGDKAQQRRLAHAVRPDQSRHASGWNFDCDVVECEHAAVALRDARELRDRGFALDHLATDPCRLAGQSTAELNFT